MTGKKTSLEEQSSQTNKSPPFLLEDVLAIVSGYFLRNNIPPPKEQDPNEKIEKHAFTLVKLYSIASKQLQGKIEIKIKEHGEQLTGSDLKNICEESEKLGIMILKDPKLHEKLNGNNLATVCQKNTILGKKILQNPTLYKKLNSENLFDICKHNTQQSTELGQIILENLTMSGRLIHSNVPGTYFACIARENPTLGKIISTNPKFYNCLTDSNFAFMCTGPFISPMVILNNIDLYNEFSPYVLLEICKKNTGFGIIILTLPTFRKTKEFNSWLSDRLMSADNEELKKIIRRRRLFTALAMTSVLFKPFSLIIDALTECIRLLCLLLTKETRDPLKNQKMSYTLRLLGTLIKAVMSILLLTTAILTGLHLVASIGITVHIGVNFLTPLVLKIMALLYMIPPNPLLCVLVPQIFFLTAMTYAASILVNLCFVMLTKYSLDSCFKDANTPSPKKSWSYFVINAFGGDVAQRRIIQNDFNESQAKDILKNNLNEAGTTQHSVSFFMNHVKSTKPSIQNSELRAQNPNSLISTV